MRRVAHTSGHTSANSVSCCIRRRATTRFTLPQVVRSSQCLRNFFSVALDQVVELNLSSLHVHHELDLMDLLPEKTLYRLEAFSAPPCAFRSQSAVRRLEASCPNLLNLDVRIQRLQGHFRCASCELLISEEWTMQPWSIPGAFYYRFKGIARLTLCDVSSEALLWFLECYGAAVVLRLSNWRHFDILHFGRLCEHLGVNDSIRCLVIQHDNLPINDERLQVSLSLMTSLRHLCLLTLMPVNNTDVLLYLDQILGRARQLDCVHIHYRPGTNRSEQRVTWLRRGQDGVLSRGGPCFGCCSTATFVGMVKPVSLSLMTSLRHLCLLTLMPVNNTDALLYLDQILGRARQLDCVHIHYRPGTDRSEQRVTWLRRGQDGVLSRGGPCFGCCSTATFIGMVKPVNRDC
ncbi:hypothetical protein HPB51_008484 [Rhipicephalus microplus]|uniref:Uncharacterized protein n=1 Tax=Rhipicephalus microplus TaxID=6941 RepID=A0A9J6ES97_RHIMP|nr:uncharacterized protein LOC119179318 [Rhipicephalus microplus]KAH8037060.1 hypothetical protein HPB51_008484 [Rhipicephalus microplus]